MPKKKNNGLITLVRPLPKELKKDFDLELAQKVLKKSKKWELPNDSKYEFVDGSLRLKGSKSDNTDKA